MTSNSDQTQTALSIEPLSKKRAAVFRHLTIAVWPMFTHEYDRDVDLFLSAPMAFNPVHVGAFNETGFPIGQAIVARSITDPDTAGITWVSVHPERRRSGLGRRLMSAALAVCHEDETVAFLTTKVPAFYRSIGFGPETPLANGRSLFVSGPA